MSVNMCDNKADDEERTIATVPIKDPFNVPLCNCNNEGSTIESATKIYQDIVSKAEAENIGTIKKIDKNNLCFLKINCNYLKSTITENELIKRAADDKSCNFLRNNKNDLASKDIDNISDSCVKYTQHSHGKNTAAEFVPEENKNKICRTDESTATFTAIIEISGIEEQPEEFLLNKVFLEIAKLGVVIDVKDVDYAFRVGKLTSENTCPRPIVLKFRRQHLANIVINAAKHHDNLCKSDGIVLGGNMRKPYNISNKLSESFNSLATSLDRREKASTATKTPARAISLQVEKVLFMHHIKYVFNNKIQYFTSYTNGIDESINHRKEDEKTIIVPKAQKELKGMLEHTENIQKPLLTEQTAKPKIQFEDLSQFDNFKRQQDKNWWKTNMLDLNLAQSIETNKSNGWCMKGDVPTFSIGDPNTNNAFVGKKPETINDENQLKSSDDRPQNNFIFTKLPYEIIDWPRFDDKNKEEFNPFDGSAINKLNASLPNMNTVGTMKCNRRGNIIISQNDDSECKRSQKGLKDYNEKVIAKSWINLESKNSCKVLESAENLKLLASDTNEDNRECNEFIEGKPLLSDKILLKLSLFEASELKEDLASNQPSVKDSIFHSQKTNCSGITTFKQFNEYNFKKGKEPNVKEDTIATINTPRNKKEPAVLTNIGKMDNIYDISQKETNKRVNNLNESDSFIPNVDAMISKVGFEGILGGARKKESTTPLGNHQKKETTPLVDERRLVLSAHKNGLNGIITESSLISNFPTSRADKELGMLTQVDQIKVDLSPQNNGYVKIIDGAKRKEDTISNTNIVTTSEMDKTIVASTPQINEGTSNETRYKDALTAVTEFFSEKIPTIEKSKEELTPQKAGFEGTVGGARKKEVMTPLGNQQKIVITPQVDENKLVLSPQQNGLNGIIAEDETKDIVSPTKYFRNEVTSPQLDKIKVALSPPKDVFETVIGGARRKENTTSLSQATKGADSQKKYDLGYEYRREDIPNLTENVIRNFTTPRADKELEMLTPQKNKLDRVIGEVSKKNIVTTNKDYVKEVIPQKENCKEVLSSQSIEFHGINSEHRKEEVINPLRYCHNLVLNPQVDQIKVDLSPQNYGIVKIIDGAKRKEDTISNTNIVTTSEMDKTIVALTPQINEGTSNETRYKDALTAVTEFFSEKIPTIEKSKEELTPQKAGFEGTVGGARKKEVMTPLENQQKIVITPQVDENKLVLSPQKNGLNGIIAEDETKDIVSPTKYFRNEVTSPQLDKIKVALSPPKDVFETVIGGARRKENTTSLSQATKGADSQKKYDLGYEYRREDIPNLTENVIRNFTTPRADKELETPQKNKLDKVIGEVSKKNIVTTNKDYVKEVIPQKENCKEVLSSQSIEFHGINSEHRKEEVINPLRHCHSLVFYPQVDQRKVDLNPQNNGDVKTIDGAKRKEDTISNTNIVTTSEMDKTIVASTPQINEGTSNETRYKDALTAVTEFFSEKILTIEKSKEELTPQKAVFEGTVGGARKKEVMTPLGNQQKIVITPQVDGNKLVLSPQQNGLNGIIAEDETKDIVSPTKYFRNEVTSPQLDKIKVALSPPKDGFETVIGEARRKENTTSLSQATKGADSQKKYDFGYEDRREDIPNLTENVIRNFPTPRADKQLEMLTPQKNKLDIVIGEVSKKNIITTNKDYVKEVIPQKENCKEVLSSQCIEFHGINSEHRKEEVINPLRHCHNLVLYPQVDQRKVDLNPQNNGDVKTTDGAKRKEDTISNTNIVTTSEMDKTIVASTPQINEGTSNETRYKDALTVVTEFFREKNPTIEKSKEELNPQKAGFEGTVGGSRKKEVMTPLGNQQKIVITPQVDENKLVLSPQQNGLNGIIAEDETTDIVSPTKYFRNEVTSPQLDKIKVALSPPKDVFETVIGGARRKENTTSLSQATKGADSQKNYDLGYEDRREDIPNLTENVIRNFPTPRADKELEMLTPQKNKLDRVIGEVSRKNIVTPNKDYVKEVIPQKQNCKEVLSSQSIEFHGINCENIREELINPLGYCHNLVLNPQVDQIKVDLSPQNYGIVKIIDGAKRKEDTISNTNIVTTSEMDKTKVASTPQINEATSYETRYNDALTAVTELFGEKISFIETSKEELTPQKAGFEETVGGARKKQSATPLGNHQKIVTTPQVDKKQLVLSPQKNELNGIIAEDETKDIVSPTEYFRYEATSPQVDTIKVALAPPKDGFETVIYGAGRKEITTSLSQPTKGANSQKKYDLGYEDRREDIPNLTENVVGNFPTTRADKELEMLTPQKNKLDRVIGEVSRKNIVTPNKDYVKEVISQKENCKEVLSSQSIEFNGINSENRREEVLNPLGYCHNLVLNPQVDQIKVDLSPQNYGVVKIIDGAKRKEDTISNTNIVTTSEMDKTKIASTPQINEATSYETTFNDALTAATELFGKKISFIETSKEELTPQKAGFEETVGGARKKEVASPLGNHQKIVTTPQVDERKLVLSPQKNGLNGIIAEAGTKDIVSPTEYFRNEVTSPQVDKSKVALTPPKDRFETVIGGARRKEITTPQSQPTKGADSRKKYVLGYDDRKEDILNRTENVMRNFPTPRADKEVEMLTPQKNKLDRVIGEVSRKELKEVIPQKENFKEALSSQSVEFQGINSENRRKEVISPTGYCHNLVSSPQVDQIKVDLSPENYGVAKIIDEAKRKEDTISYTNIVTTSEIDKTKVASTPQINYKPISNDPRNKDVTTPIGNENKLVMTQHEIKHNINTPIRTSEDPDCAICQAPCQNKAHPDMCRHLFCFICLSTWSQVKSECPLCKRPFKSIVYNIRSGNQHDEYLVNQNNAGVMAAQNRSSSYTVLEPPEPLFNDRPSLQSTRFSEPPSQFESPSHSSTLYMPRTPTPPPVRIQTPRISPQYFAPQPSFNYSSPRREPQYSPPQRSCNYNSPRRETQYSPCQPTYTSSSWECDVCGMVCKSKQGLMSHHRKHARNGETSSWRGSAGTFGW